MKIKYRNNKAEKTCTDLKEAVKLLGDKKMAVALFSRINALRCATDIRDIAQTPNFHYHHLHGALDGKAAIDVHSRSDKWRLIFEAQEDGSIMIMEVSAHYE